MSQAARRLLAYVTSTHKAHPAHLRLDSILVITHHPVVITTDYIRSLFWPVGLTIAGLLLSIAVMPREIAAVSDHITGFPDTDIKGHQMRPWLLALLCIMPAIAAWLYRCSGRLDRYMARRFLASFGLCMGALLAIMVLTDLQNHASDFSKSSHTAQTIFSYYAVFIPSTVVFILPYVLLLALLWCLGKMSRHQEIVSMIQTGRGVLRIVMPLLMTGLFCSAVCLISNYHWGPAADERMDYILDMADDGEASKARTVLFRDSKSKRVWLVGSFPYEFERTGTIRNVVVRSFNEGGHPTTTVEAEQATWSRQSKKWTFSGVQVIDLQASPVPKRLAEGDPIIRDWKETPWQIVKPGLDQTHLGIPGLNSWLKAHHGVKWANHRPYLTQWHYRYAQPIICLVVILLAAPLGIVFSRRGIGGGVSVALFLCVAMLFCSSFFLTFGEAGSLPPMLAAWATNIIFTLVAIYLFNRRISGRPIYASLKRLLPSSNQ